MQIPRMHAVPFNADSIKGEKRTSSGFLEDAKEAINCGKPVNGVKGPCWLAALKCYDIIDGTAIDYMHCVFLGIVKMLFRLWFSKEHSSAPFSISNHFEGVDQRLEQIKYPNDFSRCPRALESNLKYYKASELWSFLLFCLTLWNTSRRLFSTFCSFEQVIIYFASGLHNGRTTIICCENAVPFLFYDGGNIRES